MKSNLVKKILTTALAATFAAGVLAGCGSSSSGTTSSGSSGSGTSTSATTASGSSSSATFRTLDEIKDSGTLKVAVFSDKAPFGYVDENGDYQGYDVYFAERMAQDLGVKIEYTPVDPASRVEVVNTGKVDITLANFTVTDERAEQVDFALPYMKVQLGVVSPSDAVITDVSQLENSDKELIVAKGTTAETYFETNYPDIKLQKYDQYADAYQALLDGRGAAFSTDNTEVLAWANSNEGYTVGITNLGNVDTIAPAVAKGNSTLLEWINEEIVSLGKENFFHKDYEETLRPVYGDAASADELVVEGGTVEDASADTGTDSTATAASTEAAQ